MSDSSLILITGATGYVGGRLLERLSGETSCGKSVRVRAMARKPDGVQARWGGSAEVVAGDVLDPASLPDALKDVDTAYYLIHSMGGGGDFEAKEAESARNFGNAARDAGVKRIVFLGGLADEHQGLSPHMRSRHQTGRILRESGVPVIEFRASIILGAGSLSFEMIRALVQRLPIMITPKWVHVEAQPIAIEDLIDYLVQVLELETVHSEIYEIGGADVVSYKEIMCAYARARGLKRWFLPVPVLSPYLSSLWLGLVTPLFARVGKKLIESVTHPSVIQNPAAKQRFTVEPRGVEQAIREALEEEDRGYALTRWSDSLSSGDTLQTYAGVRFGTRLVDSRVRDCEVPPERIFQAVEKIGGTTGWYYADFLWKIRGAMDELAGGVGMRRGRRHPARLQAGDVVDCWRVESVKPGHHLRLQAEMKLPGRAWLEFELEPLEDPAVTRLRQTAIFDPKGLFGLMYWYGIFPLHGLIFKGMLDGIVKEARLLQQDGKAYNLRDR
ncbi:MAG: SDR family oxidoreductase [Kiritimatiellia bacterium]